MKKIILFILLIYGAAFSQTVYVQEFTVTIDSAGIDTLFFGYRSTAFMGNFANPDTNSIDPPNNIFDDDDAILEFIDISSDTVSNDTMAAYVKPIDKDGTVVFDDSIHVIDTDYSGGAAIKRGKIYTLALSGLKSKKNGIAIIMKRFDHETAVRNWKWRFKSN